MTEAARFGLGFIWVIASAIVGFVNKGRKIGFGRAFILSLILSPVAGICAYMLSTPKIETDVVSNDYYMCNQCGKVSPHKFHYCPNCGLDYLGRTKEQAEVESA